MELVVLAGYLQLVPRAVVPRFAGRMLNIHPALLPAFGGQGMYGLRVHGRCSTPGARVSGATVHLVDERYDEGPHPGAVARARASRRHRRSRWRRGCCEVEHLLLPAAVEALARGAGDRRRRPGAPSTSSPLPRRPPRPLRRLRARAGSLTRTYRLAQCPAHC